MDCQLLRGATALEACVTPGPLCPCAVTDDLIARHPWPFAIGMMPIGIRIQEVQAGDTQFSPVFRWRQRIYVEAWVVEFFNHVPDFVDAVEIYGMVDADSLRAACEGWQPSAEMGLSEFLRTMFSLGRSSSARR